MASQPTPAPITHVIAKRQKSSWTKRAGIVTLVAVLVAGAAAAGLAVGKMLGADEMQVTQVVRSITREEQVILLSAGISETIEEHDDGVKIFDLFNLPGSERALFMQYAYDAKFGIEGKDVKITQTGADSYVITVPEFIFLGYDNPDISVVSEANGILSWATPEINPIDIIERELTDDAVKAHIEGFRPLLEEQAKSFYNGILTSVNPDIDVDFQFTGQSPDAP